MAESRRGRRAGGLHAVGTPATSAAPGLEDQLVLVARGDEEAFGDLYDAVGDAVFGLVRRVLRDPARAEEVTQEVTTRLEHEQVRRCLGSLTDLQREAVEAAYYRGYTYREVADLLKANAATIKTRMRDGLIRLRDCLGVSA